MSDLFPPFAPDPNEPRRRLFTPVPVRVIIPNIITLIALCLGLTAIRLAFEGRYEPAVVAIVVAALLDGIDGRVARMLKGTSRFGAELDSLADFVNFGVTPALILYSFLLNELKAVGWIAVLVFAIAMVLRLARFNVMLDDPHRPEWKKNFFTGMPAPAGALTSMLPLYLSFLGVPMGPAAAPIALVYLLGLAFLMVSTIPVYSGKTIGLKVPRQWVLPIFVLSAAVFGLLANFPWEMLTAISVLFLGSIPVSAMRYRQLDRAHAQPAASEPEPPAA
ncbi:CDP-diacylglycerol--serine O-phosphatidyltransferase [Microvirga arsenatis]|uniref:CDP-diacylglycerol--serine O-phosphatidyltransferase n=1 Tax=Microvirga arsenatis TaxID=2692265 RepID=A0ABW9YRD3_9HYPH|nr:CDP-diacylglycerol--serine O-phosphatidyltransferase [Microvirga arsenatis]NBJ11588.1 CDP-diacylglycerol--serine O-phosphatidyltransferase [Microvirga arsenatis]NBJ22797.1 CDP-diacylglycerol--serine O-phosphatidyltransferase [Microvirga arsenatis]